MAVHKLETETIRDTELTFFVTQDDISGSTTWVKRHDVFELFEISKRVAIAKGMDGEDCALVQGSGDLKCHDIFIKDRAIRNIARSASVNTRHRVKGSLVTPSRGAVNIAIGKALDGAEDNSSHNLFTVTDRSDCSPKTPLKWEIARSNKAPAYWGCLRILLRKGICNDSGKDFDYLLRWCAFMLQQPYAHSGVAVVLGGPEGSGKSTLGTILSAMMGGHWLKTSDIDFAKDHFNRYLSDIHLIRMDDAPIKVGTRDRTYLRRFISEPRIRYDAKGERPVSWTNNKRVLITKNLDKESLEDVFRGPYFILESNDMFVGDKEFFDALNYELASGGIEAFYHYLMGMGLGNWTPLSALHEIKKGS